MTSNPARPRVPSPPRAATQCGHSGTAVTHATSPSLGPPAAPFTGGPDEKDPPAESSSDCLKPEPLPPFSLAQKLPDGETGACHFCSAPQPAALPRRPRWPRWVQGQRLEGCSAWRGLDTRNRDLATWPPQTPSHTLSAVPPGVTTLASEQTHLRGKSLKYSLTVSPRASETF